MNGNISGFDEELIITLKCFFGFEETLKEELLEYGYGKIEILNRAVQIRGTWKDVYYLNLHSRCSISILVEIARFRIKTENDLYQSASKIKWSNIFDVNKTFAVKGAIYSDIFTNTHYPYLLVKDAIVDHFRDETGDRPNIEIKRPQVLIDVYIRNNQVTISVNTSGNPLFQRGYRNAAGEAPINEVVAASLIRMSGWDRKTNLMDPFCGSGTILIEGALLATGIPSNIERQHYAFKNFKNFDQNLWDEIYGKATRIVRNLPCKFLGSDISDEMVLKSRRNLREFSFGRFIEISGKPFNEVRKSDESVFIISNPPYGQRLEMEEELYAEIGTWLKHEIKEGTACIISSSEEGFKSIGLKHSKKVKVYNGNLDCSFRSYELFEGKRKDSLN
ncbi:MAG: RNA methyltransferase [Flavobacteriales bacterium]|nr:MAG: RNA methyltransferase [Flavobacteriales bacterium]